MYRENLADFSFIDKVRALSDANAIKLNSEQNKLQQKKLIKINKKINKINKKILRAAQKGLKFIKINTTNVFFYCYSDELEKIDLHFKNEGFVVTTDLLTYLKITW